jgi:hypothetical protein
MRNLISIVVHVAQYRHIIIIIIIIIMSGNSKGRDHLGDVGWMGGV